MPSSGVGASPHLVGELLASEAGVKFLHVPYRGAGPALVALIGEQVDFSIADASAIPQLAAGRLRALAVTAAQRSVLLPDVPTVAEASGLAIDESSGIALLAPAGTPLAVVGTLFEAMRKVAGSDGMATRMAAQGLNIALAPGPRLGASMSAMRGRYGPLIRRLGIELE